MLAGISFATDLFDLLPPDRGGWIYGGDFERDYFDFDETGALQRRHWQASGPAETAARPMATRRIRDLALQLAIVRALRRSPLALLVATRVKLEGRSLWPNIDVVMERDIAPAHEYQHRLFKALLARLAQESAALGATLVVVGIPYLPQVYPDLARAFQNERYDRDALSRRIAAYCEEAGVRYVDTLPAFRRSFATTGRWLHYPDDGHPTPEGHDLIAQTVAESARLNVSADPATQPVGRSHPR